MLNNLIDAMENAIREVKQWPDKAVQIFHHNDSDGLSSGAILTAPLKGRAIKSSAFVWKNLILLY